MDEPLKLTFDPGIHRDGTDYSNSGAWFDGNLVRFNDQYPESVGGWQPFTSEAFTGVARSLFGWSVLNGSRYYSLGTSVKYYIVSGDTPTDVTPLRTTATLGTDPFDVTDTETEVVVNHTSHGALEGAYVTFSGATGPIGGVPASDFNQEHRITSIIDADSYTIEVDTAGTSTASGGGASVSAAYQINPGNVNAVYGTGWGTGTYGRGTWNSGYTSGTVSNKLRLWSEDNFGEDLLVNLRDGDIYFKDMSGTLSDRMVALSSLSTDTNCPDVARQILVGDNARQVIAFGTSNLGSSTQDLLRIRWSDSEDKLTWTPDSINTAGGQRIDGGSEFISAVKTDSAIMVFTDLTLHSFRYVGTTYSYGISRVGDEVRIIAPNAATSKGSEVYWMEHGNFRYFDGAVRELDCPVKDYVFSILNLGQSQKICAGTNTSFHEIIWHMPVNGSSEVNFYLAYNYVNGTWNYGSFNDTGRTAWLGANYENVPLAAAVDGYLYTHETGAYANVVGASLAALDSWVESAVFEIGTGGAMMYGTRIVPDINFIGSEAGLPSVIFSMEIRGYPGSATQTGASGTVAKTVQSTVLRHTTKIDQRFRARSAKLKISTNELGTMWQAGATRLYAMPDGQA